MKSIIFTNFSSSFTKLFYLLVIINNTALDRVSSSPSAFQTIAKEGEVGVRKPPPDPLLPSRNKDMERSKASAKRRNANESPEKTPPEKKRKQFELTLTETSKIVFDLFDDTQLEIALGEEDPQLEAILAIDDNNKERPNLHSKIVAHLERTLMNHPRVTPALVEIAKVVYRQHLQFHQLNNDPKSTSSSAQSSPNHPLSAPELSRSLSSDRSQHLLSGSSSRSGVPSISDIGAISDLGHLNLEIVEPKSQRKRDRFRRMGARVVKSTKAIPGVRRFSRDKEPEIVRQKQSDGEGSRRKRNSVPKSSNGVNFSCSLGSPVYLFKRIARFGRKRKSKKQAIIFPDSENDNYGIGAVIEERTRLKRTLATGQQQLKLEASGGVHKVTFQSSSSGTSPPQSPQKGNLHVINNQLNSLNSAGIHANVVLRIVISAFGRYLTTEFINTGMEMSKWKAGGAQDSVKKDGGMFWWTKGPFKECGREFNAGMLVFSGTKKGDEANAKNAKFEKSAYAAKKLVDQLEHCQFKPYVTARNYFKNLQGTVSMNFEGTLRSHLLDLICNCHVDAKIRVRKFRPDKDPDNFLINLQLSCRRENSR